MLGTVLPIVLYQKNYYQFFNVVNIQRINKWKYKLRNWGQPGTYSETARGSPFTVPLVDYFYAAKIIFFSSRYNFLRTVNDLLRIMDRANNRYFHYTLEVTFKYRIFLLQGTKLDKKYEMKCKIDKHKPKRLKYNPHWLVRFYYRAVNWMYSVIKRTFSMVRAAQKKKDEKTSKKVPSLSIFI